jgi:hypothetical protein
MCAAALATVAYTTTVLQHKRDETKRNEEQTGVDRSEEEGIAGIGL